MSPATSQLLSSVLALPEPERVALLEALLSSLSDDGDEWNDEQMEHAEGIAEELNRRADELRQDRSTGIAWSELKKQR